MATGANDSNGIYQYGEDDSVSPFSTLLNKLAGSVSSAVGAIRSDIGTLQQSVTALTNRQRIIAANTGAVSTDGSGNVTISHGLGKVPTSVLLTNMPGGSIPGMRTIAFVSATANDFTVRAYRQDQTGGTATLNNNAIQFAWAVIG